MYAFQFDDVIRRAHSQQNARASSRQPQREVTDGVGGRSSTAVPSSRSGEKRFTRLLFRIRIRIRITLPVLKVAKENAYVAGAGADTQKVSTALTR